MQPAALTIESSTNDIAAYAKPFWEKATGLGTPNATTSFHNEYNKRDFTRVPGKLNRYTGPRAMSHGFMKGGVKMMKFLTSDEGCSLVGVDCSKPGSGGEQRQNRIRKIGDEFLALAAHFSKLHEYEVGDVEAVAEARGMAVSTFATFVGFSYAIVSPEFQALKRKWLAAERAEQAAQVPPVAPVSQATPLAVVVGVQLPPSAAPAAPPERPPRDPRVVNMDSSEDEEDDAEVAQATDGWSSMRAHEALHTPVPMPAPAPAPAPAYQAAVHVDDSGIEAIPTVVVRSGHEESVNVRINTPAEHRAQETPAAAPEPAPAAPEEPEGFCPELHAKIFVNDDDDDAASDRSASPVVMPDEVCDGLPDMHEERKRLEAEQRREAAAAAAAAAAKPASERAVRFAPKPQVCTSPMPKFAPKPAAVKREAPPPPKPSPAKKQRVATDATVAPVDYGPFFTDAEWRALGNEIMSAYLAAKAAYKTNVYDAENTPLLNAQTSLYFIDTKRRADGKSAGQQDTDVHFAPKSLLHKILKKLKLRSVPDICRAFDIPKPK